MLKSFAQYFAKAKPLIKYFVPIFIGLVFFTGCAKRQVLNTDQANLALLDYIDQAATQEDHGDIKGAVKTYKQALEINRGSALLHLYIAQSYYDLGNDTLAVLYAKRASRLDTTSADPHLILGNAYMIAKDWPAALVEYQKAFGLNPRNTEIPVTLSGLYEIVDQPDSAQAVLLRALHENGDPEIQVQLAGVLARAKKYQPAIEQYLSVLLSDPQNAKASLSLAALYEAVGQPDSAYAYYLLAEGLSPKNQYLKRHIFNLLLLKNDYPGAILKAEDIFALEIKDNNLRLQLARLYYQQKDFSNAFINFDLLLRDDSLNTEALYTLARLKMEQKQYQEASGYFGRTLKILPRLAEGWLNLGICQLARERKDSAEVSFKRSRRHGNKMQLDYIWGYAYGQLEQYSQAIPHYLKLYPKNKKDLNLIFNLAAAYERSGDFEAAERYFLLLLARQPKNHLALNYLGYMYAERGINLDQAETMVAQALQSEPENAYYIDSMGWIYFKQGKMSRAGAELERAVKLMPEDAAMRDHLGDAYLARGQKEQALEQWRKALELDPKKEEIKKKIETHE
jgi:tetratricopeptide (TPR) repeat protein